GVVEAIKVVLPKVTIAEVPPDEETAGEVEGVVEARKVVLPKSSIAEVPPHEETAGETEVLVAEEEAAFDGDDRTPSDAE
ncbi:hypothetical protein ACH5RR_017523, partial [Cinchona calisaya]